MTIMGGAFSRDQGKIVVAANSTYAIMGKRKIEIKRIDRNKDRKVAFTKRRKGLFGKANEFCDRTDAQIAIITFSLADRPFAFGQPSADSVIDRYCKEQDEKGKFWLEKPIEGMGLDELKGFVRWVEDELEETRMRVSCTKDLLSLNWRENPEVDEMKMREACTKDFLASSLWL